MKLSSAAPVQSARVSRALLSVFDKTGLIELARGFAKANVELVASGGTAHTLQEAGLPILQVDAFTGSPEVLGGRVKTLHPRIHAGILAHRADPTHQRDVAQHDLPPIDVVVCNLYPFAQALSRNASRAEMIENIDIGGPTLVRAAAKNADGGVTVITDPRDYARVVAAVQAGAVPLELRRELAVKAFATIAVYDQMIAEWAARDLGQAPTAVGGFELKGSLRYGENPHQPARLYTLAEDVGGVAKGELLQGKELSYNNYLDLDGAFRAATSIEGGKSCSIVKHTNPCGLASDTNQAKAFERALAGDPVSAFGGIIGFNTPLEEATAKAIRASKLFVECIVAPDVNPRALELFGDKEALRIVKVPGGSGAPAYHAHRIGGGLLVQATDPGIDAQSTWRTVTKKQLEPWWLDELAFAMRAVAALKSNAIVVTKERAMRGAGAGQMSRVDATEQALKKAGEACRGAFLASDAFFPFDDSVRLAAEAGIVAVVQPGGSKRDAEVIAACDELGLAMVFTGRRHFRH